MRVSQLLFLLVVHVQLIFFEKNRDNLNPGEIDYDDYVTYSFQKMRDIISYFFAAGGDNLFLEVLDINLLSDKRGAEYTELAINYAYELVNSDFITFYENNHIDVRFVGIDVIQKLDKTHPARQLGDYLSNINNNWQYHDTHHKLIWNIASIHLHSIYNTSIENTFDVEFTNMKKALHKYYSHFSEKIYGFYLPQPNLYIGSNRRGELSLSSRLPIAIGVEHDFRLFYVPFPTFFMTQHHFDAIINDLGVVDLADETIDYSNQLTSLDVKKNYELFKKQASDTSQIAGLRKKNK